MAGLSIAGRFDRTRLAAVADWLMVAVAVALPWSTSATGILLVLWLLALIPALEWSDVRRELLTPAGGLPVLLFLLGVLGMAWADVSLLERWQGLDSFFKLLVIPLLMTQFRRSGNGERVFIGFLAACVALLVASLAVSIWPELPKGSSDAGVAVKNYIVQSAEFTMCAAVLLHRAVESSRRRQWTPALAGFVLALLFLADIFFVATSRTTLVVIVVLVLLFGFRQFGWKGFMLAAAVGLATAATLWVSSPYLRDRVAGVLSETERFEAKNVRTPSGERLMFWTRSIGFVESAPLLGHGTGSISEMFRHAAIGQKGVRAEVASNPHNQTFAVAIQLGLIGAAVLWAMWIFHFLLFRGGGLAAWIGLVVVAQNIVGSLFNSFLFDFTEGWLYVVGVGVAAGIILRGLDTARPGTAATVSKS
jgi:O-antigen ligase